MEGHPGLKPGRLQDGGFTEIFFKNSAVKVFIKSRKRNRVAPSAVSINFTNDPYLSILITRGPSPYVHNLRVYSISEETQSELQGATPNFWPQSLDQVSRRNDYLQLSPTIQNFSKQYIY